MKRWSFLMAAALVMAGTSLAAFGDTYILDPVHCSAIFRIKHNGASYVYGRINGPEGTLVYDAAKPEASAFDITMKAANIDTNNAQRDTHLKSASFFNAKEYPELTFKAKSVKKADGDSLEVTCVLTIHGVTTPLTVKLDHTGDGTGGTIGFEGTFTINRNDFDIKEMPGALGDDVRIIVAFEAKKK